MADQEIITPVPGTFYRRPDPDSDVFCNEGDTIEPGATIGLVEIMKNFQEVNVETAGTLTRFLVDNEELVSAGQAVAVIEVA